MRYVSLILTLLLLTGVYLESRNHPTPRSAAPYHEKVAMEAARLPMRIGQWVGTDNSDKIPPAAQKLLKPNVLLGRSYRHEANGLGATLIFVQCLDSGDMGGHYPPVCYVAHGWTIDPTRDADNAPGVEVSMRVGDRMVPVREYEFRVRGFPRDRHVRIFSFFVIPGVGVSSTLAPVSKAAGDYRLRPFGAAQTQVVFDGSVQPEMARAAAAELIEAMLPLIDAVKHNESEGEK